MSIRGLTGYDIARLPQDEREAFIASLTEQEAQQLIYDWSFWARDNQLPPPGNWSIWLDMKGRGSGKTRAGAEWIRKRHEQGFGRFGLIAPTAADARDVMIEGESGLLAVCPPWDKPKYLSSLRRVEWDDGASALLFSAEEPERMRGPQFDTVWGDEVGAWNNYGALDQARFALRLSKDPRMLITTTPRPIPPIVELVKQAEKDRQERPDNPRVVITTGTTMDNLANLPEMYLDAVLERYKGTRLGQQELEGMLLTNVDGAPWHREDIIVRQPPPGADFTRIVVGVDPTVGKGTASAKVDDSREDRDHNSCGIVVAGLATDGNCYVIADRTRKGSPNQWAEWVVEAFDDFRADRIIAEVNQGGALVEALLSTVRRNLPYTPVSAMRGKLIRTEPVVALYEQSRVFHMEPFKELENQMCTWLIGQPSPDRMDALVWAITHLMVKSEKRITMVLAQGIAHTRTRAM